MSGNDRPAWPVWARRRIALVSVVLSLCGCGTMGNTTSGVGPLGGAAFSPAKIGYKLDHSALRKQVEADSFPTPAEAGI